MAAVEAGRLDAIVTWHNDRLHRSPRELEAFIDLVERFGVRLAVVTGGDYDSTRPDGRLSARIVGAVARKESEDRSRRVRRKQLEHASVHADIDGHACLDAFSAEEPRLAEWTAEAAAAARAALAAIGAEALPLTIVHGDFAEWNVHYLDGQLTGVVDFGLTHLDSRPYELAIARTHRSPETIDAYAGELGRSGWPLSELEREAIGPVNHAFRVDMVAWELHQGRKTGV